MGRHSLEPGSVLLGKYRIERVLGRGGMGVVVSARHLHLDEVVAIKILSDEIGVSPETFERFHREARAAAKLKSTHAVRVVDVGRLDDGVPYMVMELLEGTDLRALRKPTGIDPGLVATAMIQTCEVLAEAHALGIVHRDLKPANLFVTQALDGTPFIKVLDFGIAKVSDPMGVPITKTSSMLGTPAYMSPEQLRSSRTVDHRTDLWALGVVTFELLEGKRPFDHEALTELIMQIAMRPPAPAQRMPAPLAAIVMRLLDKDPNRRFQTALELAEALVPFAPDRARADSDVSRIRALLKTTAERSDSTPVPTPIVGRLGATVDVGPAPAASLHAAPTRPNRPRDDEPDMAPTAAAIPARVAVPVAPPTLAARPVALSDAEHPNRFSAAVTAAIPEAPHVSTQQGAWTPGVRPAFTPLESPGSGGAFAAARGEVHADGTPSPSTIVPAPFVPPVTVAPAPAPPARRGRRVAVAVVSLTVVAAGALVAISLVLNAQPEVQANVQSDAPPVATPDPVPQATPPVDAATAVAAPDPVDAAVAEPPAEPPTPDAGTAAGVAETPVHKKTRRDPKRPPNSQPPHTGATTAPTPGSASEPCDPMKSRFGC